jgi:predicted Zn-dependent peptidase
MKSSLHRSTGPAMPSWEISTLTNGLRVVTTPMPNSQGASASIFIGVGSRAESRRVNGVSHYLEHMLFKGTDRRPDAITIAEAIEGAGGVLNAYTAKELTCYWNQVPYDMLDVAMDVVSDMVLHSRIDEEEIERERTVVQQEIRRSHDQPGAWAGELMSLVYAAEFSPERGRKCDTRPGDGAGGTAPCRMERRRAPGGSHCPRRHRT